LLQQRALSKYHSAGLWTNACCSHPRPGEDVGGAALRRLSEELGFTAGLEKAFDFIYRAEFENGLTEYEFDHVFAGVYDGAIHPDEEEVRNYCFLSPAVIRSDLVMHPSKYTAWFQVAFPMFEKWAAGKALIRRD
jgi:isopentenyl-diphosphate Delta-isomerase